MTCREEHWTPDSRMPPKLRLQLRLRNISIAGTARLQHAKNMKYARRLRKIQDLQRRYEAKFRKSVRQVKRKVNAWKKELQALRHKVLKLSQKHKANPESVTVEDWEEATKGSEKKMKILFSKNFPRSEWPEGVPYLNVVAYRAHRRKLRAERAAAKLIQAQAPDQQEAEQHGQNDVQMQDDV